MRGNSATAEVDQCEAGFFVAFSPEMPGRLSQNQLQGGPDGCGQNMTAMRASVRLAYDHVSVNLRSTVFERDVANQRKNFHLFANGDFLIFLFLPVKIAERNLVKGADGGKMAAAKLFLFGQRQKSANKLIAF